MLAVQLVLLSLAGLISIAFGVRYFLAREYMPYHAVVAGSSWAELEPGVRTVILGMLKILAGGFIEGGGRAARGRPARCPRPGAHSHRRHDYARVLKASLRA